MVSHKISLRPGCYGAHSMVAYEHVKEIGVEYLELGIPDNPAMFKDMLEDPDLGFKVGSFTFEIDTSDPTVVSRFEKTCAFCSQFPFVYFFSSVKSKGVLGLFGKSKEKGYKVLQKMGDIAERYGKFISMETHPPYCLNADEMLKTMQAVNHKAVRINFDTANIYYYNHINIGDGITQMDRVKQYIGSLHIKQTNGEFHGWYFPPLNDPKGIVDYKKVFAIMDGIKFDGIYTLELEGVGGDTKKYTVEDSKKQVAESVAFLRSCEK